MSALGASDSRICVLGANGQVGLEVSLFLSEMPGVGVVPVSRTQYGSALLRHLGLECRHGRLSDERQANALLQGATLLADFGWPTNTIGKMDAICAQIRNAIRHAPAGAPYVFISTQSVFCLDPAHPEFTAYRLAKLRAEQTALQQGRKVGRPVFVLRLGQVHGPLQSVSRAITREFRAETAYVPALDSYAVFTYSIAEALANIAAGREAPGTYTLLAYPQWRWTEVHAYYARWTGLVSKAIEEPPQAAATSTLARSRAALQSFCSTEIFRHREWLEYWGARLFPRRMQQLRLAHYRRQAGAEIDELRAKQSWRPYGQKIQIPGARLESISDIRGQILEKNQRMLRRVLAGAPDAIQL